MGWERKHLNRQIMAAAIAIVVVGCGTMLSACGGGDEATAKADAVTEKDFDAGNFSKSTRIDNKWFPLRPGTEFVMEGRSNRGEGRLPHRVVTTVTDLTKTIDGVPTLVLWDRDINAGKLLEAELAFHGQDDDGNVWNFGEYPEQYDEQGRFEGAPDTWISGLDGARAGILMRGDPRPGTPRYHQGLAPKIGFADLARVYKQGVRNCVPLGCYENVLLTDETNPTEPDDGHQIKYYASGVGTIRAEPRGGKEKEVLVLIAVRHLDGRALARVRREALKLDRRAYRSKQRLWSQTPPAKPPGE
jgi:hypothetical protein